MNSNTISDGPIVDAWNSFAGVPCSLSWRDRQQIEPSTLIPALSRALSHCASPRSLAERLFLPKSASPDSHWLCSRDALLSAYLQLDRSAQDLVFSLSHSQDASVAIGAKGLRSIGVDLESSGRQLSERAEQRISSAPERALGLTPLELWTIKEACFKANPDSTQSFVSQYQVKSYDGRDGEVTAAERSFRFRLVQTQEWTIAFAIY